MVFVVKTWQPLTVAVIIHNEVTSFGGQITSALGSTQSVSSTGCYCLQSHCILWPTFFHPAAIRNDFPKIIFKFFERPDGEEIRFFLSQVARKVLQLLKWYAHCSRAAEKFVNATGDDS
jgi:hypothetical protein